MKKIILIIIVAVVMLQGCVEKSEDYVDGDIQTTNQEGTENEMNDTSDQKDPIDNKTEVSDMEENKTMKETEKATQVPTSTPTPTPELVMPLTVNDTGKVLIQTVSTSTAYPYTSYIITSVNGESIVLDPTSMPDTDLVDINPAGIFITHGHPDHNDRIFLQAYDCPTVKYEKADIQLNDFHVYTILSSHNNDTIIPENFNVMIVLEVDGLRIAHMGDIGQTFLTEEQLKELGEIDIAFMQFENSYSSMSLKNKKGFQLIEQLNPKIVIPTHYTDNTLPVLEEKYGPITEFENKLAIATEDLPEKNLTVYRILNNYKYK
ncbi:MBL fold metallo-hydrolase [Mobilitalea sibirica]|uniref:MBL fold metallo-hydrolase n=1 Tax=Mobilitalea sibirica TaxID=1462919 RepID=A0A8J7HCL3_9FIRM|nr:MBL fold metallo-hydrolase [Mobilitalea sibirica]MBH1942206.1 MBL fold metallo-hydrolase [Mobilitalea sibirica]